MIDLSRSLRGLLDGALDRARQSESCDAWQEAAEAWDDAARLADRYAEHASGPQDKQRRAESAERFRQHAAALRARAAQPVRSGPASGSLTSGSPSAKDGDTDADHLREAITRLIHKSNVAWDQVAGLSDTKRTIQTAYALSLAQAPTGVRVEPVRNLLFYGPPGCGKSLLAAATSTGLEATFFNVQTSHLVSKWFGESPKLVSTLYSEARRQAPSVIFMDEIDALAANRDQSNQGPERRLLANLLAELDGLVTRGSDGFVLTIAATNAPWSLDPAVLSRFEHKVFIPLPDHDARRQIFELQLSRRGYPLEFQLNDLAERTEGYSGRELERLTKRMIERMIWDVNPDLVNIAGQGRAAAADYQLQVRPLRSTDAEAILVQHQPETPPELLQRYRRWAEGG